MRKIKGSPQPFGASVEKNKVNFAVQAPAGKKCELLLYRKGEESPQCSFEMPEEEGIGEVRKKALFKRFHSLKGLKQASIEQLQEVLPEKVAKNVYEVLQHPERNEDDCIE